jgi:hypothetical protein
MGSVGCLGGYTPSTTQGSATTPTNTNNTTAAAQDAGPVKTSANDAGVLQAAPPPASTAAAELVKFGNCMQLADWNSSGMNDVQNQDTAGDAGECYSCHQSGMYNVALTKDPDNNYNLMHTMPWLMKFAQATTAADGTFQDITATERIRDRGTEAGHPVYVLTTTRQSALDNFFMMTYTHYKAGNCPAPSVAPPIDGGI